MLKNPCLPLKSISAGRDCFSQCKLILKVYSYIFVSYGIMLLHDYRNAPLQTWMTCPFTCLPMSEARKRQAFA